MHPCVCLYEAAFNLITAALLYAQRGAHALQYMIATYMLSLELILTMSVICPRMHRTV